ncbi:MAG TPA: DUF3788 family protein [bacterium]|nr:DUF3788 family protein [bacterium]HPN43423.1 DUF3788 family protein [bacterium]
MSYGVFTDKAQIPTDAAIATAVGEALRHWQTLIDYVNSHYKTSQELKFYGVNYGWALRIKKSGKALLALYPGNDYFTVLVILNSNQLNQVMQLDLDPYIMTTIQQASLIIEGKWLFFKITPASQINIMHNIEELIKIRASKK